MNHTTQDIIDLLNIDQDPANKEKAKVREKKTLSGLSIELPSYFKAFQFTTLELRVLTVLGSYIDGNIVELPTIPTKNVYRVQVQFTPDEMNGLYPFAREIKHKSRQVAATTAIVLALGFPQALNGSLQAPWEDNELSEDQIKDLLPSTLRKRIGTLLVGGKFDKAIDRPSANIAQQICINVKEQQDVFEKLFDVAIFNDTDPSLTWDRTSYKLTNRFYTHIERYFRE